MTPNKTTGQIHGVIVPVPENLLSQEFCVPIMLDIPPVKDHSAVGLAIYAREVFNSFGFADSQLEGIGVDGEYIKKGVKSKLLELLDIENWTEDDKDFWITAVWEPAHQLELTTKDVRKSSSFEWLENLIDVVSDITNLLNIGKGLEQSRVAAAEVGEKFYKLKALSDTRFSAYFESALINFERRTETTVAALRKRVESSDKKVKETAARLLREMCSQKFLILNLGLLDVYGLLGSISSQLQTVQQFPWDITKKQTKLIETLQRMSKLKLTLDEQTGEFEEIDESLWPKLGQELDSVLEGRYVSVQTVLEVAPRRGRSASDISANQSLLQTVENRLTSLCTHLASVLQSRLEDTPTPSIIPIMSKCLDLEDIVSKEETADQKSEREKDIKALCKAGKVDNAKIEAVVKQYNSFKDKLINVVKCDEKDEVVKRFETFLFETHSCSKDCQKGCSDKDKVILPRIPVMFKIVHLFFKEPSLYLGLEDFLSLFLRCIVKTHAEGCAESMGNLVDMHCDKRRGRMDIESTGREAAIHWNCPPLVKADGLGGRALDRLFGHGKWNFVTNFNQADSTVTKRLKKLESKLAFF